jgi:hypothetical protein
MTRCNVSFGVPGVRSRISRFNSPILAAPVPYTSLLTQQSSTARPGGPVAVPETGHESTWKHCREDLHGDVRCVSSYYPPLTILDASSTPTTAEYCG